MHQNVSVVKGNKMEKEDFIIRTYNNSGNKTIEIINNIDDDDDWIPQWKPRKKKKKRTEKLDPSNPFEAEIIRQRMKRLADRLKALH